MTVSIRAATPADAPAILRMVRDLATFERQPDAVKASAASIAAHLAGEDAPVHAFLAERDGHAVGLALWFLNYSTWTGTQGLYLEDLFVDPAARGTGVGRALFAALAREALTRGCARIDWAVLDWNEPAMDFYRAIGGCRSMGWQPWRLDGAALARMADSVPLRPGD